MVVVSRPRGSDDNAVMQSLRMQEPEHLEQRQVLALEGAVSEEKTLKKRKEVSRVELMAKGSPESSDLYRQIAWGRFLRKHE